MSDSTRILAIIKDSVGMEYRPHFVDYLTMCFHDVKIKTIWILSFEITEEGFAIAGHFHDACDCVSSKESVEFGYGTVECLCSCSALEFKVHLFGMRGSFLGSNKSSEFLCMKCSVLDRRVGEPEEMEIIRRFVKRRDRERVLTI